MYVCVKDSTECLSIVLEILSGTFYRGTKKKTCKLSRNVLEREKGNQIKSELQ